VEDQTIGLANGRMVGFADYGIPGATAVLWCHGGPGSRLEPAYLRRVASEAGLRIIGIDRPGYGLSTPQPGRTIAGWVPEALAVADHLGIGQFAPHPWGFYASLLFLLWMAVAGVALAVRPGAVPASTPAVRERVG